MLSGSCGAAGVEGLHVANALAHCPAPFEHQGPIALLGQKVSGNDAGGSGPDDERPLGERFGARRRHLERRLFEEIGGDRRAPPPGLGEDLPFVLRDHDFERIDKGNVAFVACIQALAKIRQREISAGRTSSARLIAASSPDSDSSTPRRIFDRRIGTTGISPAALRHLERVSVHPPASEPRTPLHAVLARG